MRLPIILMLLTVLLLPADLRGLVAQVQSGADTARVAVAKFLDRNDDVKVADVTPKLRLGTPVTEIR
jgi:hypothetical protein